MKEMFEKLGKRIAKRMEEMLQDEQGISQIIVVALLIAIAVVAVAVIGAFVGGMVSFQKTPSVKMTAVDAPDDVATGNAFVVRHLGGDRVRYADMILAIYDVDTGQKIYDGVVSTDSNITSDELSAAGYSNTFFEGGEQLVVQNGVLGATPSPGTYEIVIYYKPTMQPLMDQQLSIT